MPRRARQPSGTGYMHIIVRGIGKQILFEEREDYLFYLFSLKRFSRETETEVCAYCLMDNHVHLLLYRPDGEFSVIMKKLGVSYSKYYNEKYERMGHLFQDRYRSEAITDNIYLLTVFRYILKNPEKAGICPARDYEWSSYRAYGDPNAFARPALLEKMIGDQSAYEAFVASEDDKVDMDFDQIKHDDQWAILKIRQLLGGQNGTALQNMDRKTRDEMLKKLKEEGLTIRQMERLTGLNRGIIQRA